MRTQAALISSVLVLGLVFANAANSRPDFPKTAEDVLSADCLLPEQVRKLVFMNLFFSPRRPAHFPTVVSCWDAASDLKWPVALPNWHADCSHHFDTENLSQNHPHNAPLRPVLGHSVAAMDAPTDQSHREGKCSLIAAFRPADGMPSGRESSPFAPRTPRTHLPCRIRVTARLVFVHSLPHYYDGV